MEQIISRYHEFNSIRFNVTPGLVLVGRVHKPLGYVYFLFEVAFNAEAHIHNKVGIESGSISLLDVLHGTPGKLKTIAIADCSWPTETELHEYKNTSIGI